MNLGFISDLHLSETDTSLTNAFVDFLKSKTNAKILAEKSDIPLTKIEHWFRYDESGFSYPSIEDWKKVRKFIDDYDVIDEGLSYYELKTDEVVVSDKKNKRSVWTVATKPFKGAHFATFPMDLIEPCVLAGCPEKVCVACGTPYKKEIVVEKNLTKEQADEIKANLIKTDKLHLDYCLNKILRLNQLLPLFSLFK